MCIYGSRHSREALDEKHRFLSRGRPSRNSWSRTSMNLRPNLSRGLHDVNLARNPTREKH